MLSVSCIDCNMKLNPTESISMVVSRYQSLLPAYLDLILEYWLVPTFSEVKVLGVILNNRLTFEGQTRFLVSNASKKLGLLRRFSSVFDGNYGLNSTRFRRFILLLLEYCSPVWMSAANCHLKLLDRVAYSTCFFFPNLQYYDLWKMRHVGYLSRLYNSSFIILLITRWAYLFVPFIFFPDGLVWL